MLAYLKAIMAVIGAVLTSLSVYYGHTTWYPIVVTGVTAFTVWLVPNLPKTPAITAAPVNPTTQANTEPWPAPAKTDDGWENVR